MAYDTGTVALVTGGNRGIGLAICRALAGAGQRVLLASRDPARGAAAASELAGAGLPVRAVTLDVADETSVQALARRIEADPGRLDVLVNNAGVFLDSTAEDGASVLTVSAQKLRETLQVNLLGALRVTQAVAGLLRRSGRGRVVNVSSSMGQLDSMQGGWPAYRISKTALNALTRLFAAELADDGVLVNSFCPGWVRTGIGGSRAPRSPDEAADTALWLATLAADGPTGGFFRDRAPIPW